MEKRKNLKNLFLLTEEQRAALQGEGELHEILLQSKGRGLRIERILSAGQTSPPGFWYDQQQDEWVALLQGRAGLSFDDGRSVTLEKGDWLFLPAHTRHRLDWTSREPPCIWLAVHLEP